LHSWIKELSFMVDTRLLPPGSWSFPAKTWVLAATHRSGSAALAEACIITGVLGRPWEWFNPKWDAPAVTSKETNNTSSSVATLCAKAGTKGRTPNGVVGIKLFPSVMAAIQKEIRLDDWFPSPYWVWLRRRDILAQAISRVIANQTGQWQSRDRAQGQPVYDAAAITRWLFSIVVGNAEWEAYFATSGVSPLCLWYEDFCSAPQVCVSEIAMFLGEDISSPQHDGIQLPIKKQSTQLNRDWADRYLTDMQTSGKKVFLLSPYSWNVPVDSGIMRLYEELELRASRL
jgi:LPS sulfotransferase NodH